jgi:hypothetical protein
MTVKKEVYEKCKKMIERELSEAQSKIKRNKAEVNKISKEQRVLKVQVGELFALLRSFRIKEDLLKK